MIRLNRLLRTAKLVHKLPARSGPGWDRPDVPPTQKVPRDTKWSQDQIIYTFFDPSMPQYIITEPQIYEGTLIEGLPSLLRVWGLLVGTALAFYTFNTLVNNQRTNKVVEPVSSQFLVTQAKKINEGKTAFKNAKENPFGVNVNPDHFPHYNNGVYSYPRRYFVIQDSFASVNLINQQAAAYLKAAFARASQPAVQSHDHHGHH